MSTRIPYGYRIVNGSTEPDPEQAEKLRHLFAAYLQGYSLREAKELSGIDRTWVCCRNMLVNPVYLGTGDYPQIISAELMQQAIHRVTQRGAHLVGRSGKAVRRPIKIQTEFEIDRKRKCDSEDPVEMASRMYRCIINVREGGRKDDCSED